jgi:hypothetical protein
MLALLLLLLLLPLLLLPLPLPLPLLLPLLPLLALLLPGAGSGEIRNTDRHRTSPNRFPKVLPGMPPVQRKRPEHVPNVLETLLAQAVHPKTYPGNIPELFSKRVAIVCVPCPFQELARS